MGSAAVSVVNWTQFDAVLFDLDGVVTPTAEIHQRAWAALFEPWDYTADDYLRSIDGRPRYDGVATFLASRQVELPWGQPTDSPDEHTICGLGNRKNEMFHRILATDGIAPYPGTMRVLDLLDQAQIRSAIVSSSLNARSVLAAADLTDRFSVVVDGTTATEYSLAGKPDPAMFLHAADQLALTPDRCIVVEDATSGVDAARAGRFGLVIGVDRGGNWQALLNAGADLVVDDLDTTLAQPTDLIADRSKDLS